MENIPHIGKEIRNLSLKLKRAVDENTSDVKPKDFTKVQGWILGYIAHNSDKDIFQKDVEREFNIRRSTATGILKLMEGNGYIERVPVERDGRLKKLLLTPKASEMHDNISREIANAEKQLTKGLTQNEIDQFLIVIKKMADNFE